MISHAELEVPAGLKYIEFGIGNRWLVRTETEKPDGTETEARELSGLLNAVPCI